MGYDETIITVKKLKQYLEKANDDAEVVIKYGDELENELVITGVCKVSTTSLINNSEVSYIEICVDERQYSKDEF